MIRVPISAALTRSRRTPIATRSYVCNVCKNANFPSFCVQFTYCPLSYFLTSLLRLLLMSVHESRNASFRCYNHGFTFRGYPSTYMWDGHILSFLKLGVNQHLALSEIKDQVQHWLFFFKHYLHLILRLIPVFRISPMRHSFNHHCTYLIWA